jgi:hypothetical protein
MPDWKEEITKRFSSLELDSTREVEITQELAQAGSNCYRPGAKLCQSGIDFLSWHYQGKSLIEVTQIVLCLRQVADKPASQESESCL